MTHSIVIVFALLILLIAAGIIGAVLKSSADEKRARCFEADHLANLAFGSTRSKTIRARLEELEDAVSDSGSSLSRQARELYEEDIAELREHLADIEREEYEELAAEKLDLFLYAYLSIVSRETAYPKSADRLYAQKGKCLRAWQDFFAIDLTQWATAMDPRGFLREWMDEDYDPCMETLEALDRKLTRCIEEISARV